MKFNLLDPELEAFPEKLGGKARNLRILKNWGLPVPDAFVLTEDGDFDLKGDISEIGGFPVAVRSSGALEDLEGASFAGLYETFLFVNSHEELKAAITKCFDSKNSHRVHDYLKQK